MVTEGGDVGVFALNVGDCFDDPPDVQGDGDGSVEAVAAVPCDEPHDNQVYHKFDLPDGDFPGEDATFDRATAGCIAQFEAAVGEAYETSPLDIFPLTPTESGWAAGDQEVICSIYNLDLSKLTADALG